MKKILMLFAAAALVLGAASCQKENFQKALAEGQEQIDYSDDPMGVIKVYIKKDDTKMAFGENEQTGKLKRSWEKDDVIDGCTKVGNEYKSFQYAVDEVGSEGGRDYVKLIKKPGAPGIPSATTTEPIHFVYAPGAVSFDSEGACSLDLSKQDESHIPAVMVASGTVDLSGEEPHLDLTGENGFKNIAAVVAIRDGITLKDVDDVEVTDYTINKVYAIARTKGTLTLNNGAYEISAATPDDFWPTTISPKDGEESFSAEDPIYIAALPGNGKISAELRTDKGKFVWETSGAQNLGANAYARIKNKEYKQRAEAEIGDKRYAIEDAFVEATKAEGDVTIKMVDNAVTYEEITFTKENGKKITLDLNTKTITSKNLNGDGRVFESNSPFEVKNGTITGGLCAIHSTSTLVLTDANFYAKGKTSSAVINMNTANADLTMTNCHVEATTTESTKWGDIRAVNVEGKAEIKNSVLKSEAHALRAYSEKAEATVVDVTATECISGGNAATVATSRSGEHTTTININSGYFFADNAGDMFTTGSGRTINVKGGYFNKEVTAAEGYGCKTCEPQYDSYGNQYSWNVVVNPVAQVDGVDKYNRDDAISALNSSNAESPKMTLLSNWSPSEMIVVKNENGKKVTIDFNGYTIESSVPDTAAVRTETPVKFTSSKATTNTPGGITALYKALLVVSGDSEADGGVFTSTCDDNAKCVVQVGSVDEQTPADVHTDFKFYGNAKITAPNGVRGMWSRGPNGRPTNVEISGNASIVTKYRPLYGYAYSTVTVKENACLESTSNANCVYNGSQNGTVYVSGGYFKKATGTTNMFGQSSNARIIVSGGHYTQSLGDKGFSFADNYGEFDDGEGDYRYYVAFKQSDPEVYLNGEGIASLTTAVERVNEMTTSDPIEIKLNKDITSGSAFKFTNTSSKKITLDLNNHSITFTQRSAYLNITAGVKACLKDGSEEQGGKVEQTAVGNSDNYSKCILVNGTVTIESGTYIMNCTKTNANNETVRTDNDAILTITGGNFSGVYCTLRCQGDSKLTVKGETFVTTFGADQTGTGASTGVGIQVRENATVEVMADDSGNVPVIGSTKFGAIYAYSKTCNIKVFNGYFWTDGSKAVLSANTDCASRIVATGGKYSKAPNSSSYDGNTYELKTIDESKSFKGYKGGVKTDVNKTFIREIVKK